MKERSVFIFGRLNVKAQVWIARKWRYQTFVISTFRPLFRYGKTDQGLIVKWTTDISENMYFLRVSSISLSL